MAFTITFTTHATIPATTDVATWLTDQGEAFEQEGPYTLALKALPVRVVLDEGVLKAHLEVGVETALARMVDLLFALSVEAGADVRLAGLGEVTRPRLWLKLADEQDRVRIQQALQHASEHHNREEVLQRLWSVLHEIAPGHDLRWDAHRGRIVELVEVGEPGGISVEEASWLVEGAKPGDAVPRPVDGQVHIIAWRWLSEAYPGLAEP